MNRRNKNKKMTTERKKGAFLGIMIGIILRGIFRYIFNY